MRIVSYNVNGLRPRVAQSRSLTLFLDSLNADIICLQETKLSRQELTADIAVAEGYESFFSCTRTVQKGRIHYSGVATFCRVGPTSSSTSPVLPLAADEGITGLLHFSRPEEVHGCKGRVGYYEEVFKTELSPQELFRLDIEGRCLVTDHGSFVLFNIYAPMVEPGDTDREEFKGHFFRTLQRRWECLLRGGRRVIALGDFNVSPYPIDNCNPGPNFDKQISRKWLRSVLHAEGGPFRDVFRFIHPDRKEAYTCWSQSTGAEEFNYGTRIDLIIAAGRCSHEAASIQQVSGRGHSFVECEVQDSDILSEFRRGKADSLPRWHGGRSLKLEGSDHVPIYVQLKEQCQVELHEVPPLAARYMPELRGRQQNLVSLLKRQPSANDIRNSEPTNNTDSFQTADSQLTPSFSFFNTSVKTEDWPLSSSQKRPLVSSSLQKRLKPKRTKGELVNLSTTKKQDAGSTQRQKQSNLRAFFVSSRTNAKASFNLEGIRTTEKTVESIACQETVFEEKAVVEELTGEQASLSLLTFEKQTDSANYNEVKHVNISAEEKVSLERYKCGALEDLSSIEILDALDCTETAQTDIGRPSQTEIYTMTDSQEKSNAAFEWRRIQTAMARAVPICQGHKEPCVARVVKKQGPNKGRGFYVCARAQGPSSNPEARCDHFEWSCSPMRSKGKVLGE